MVALIGSGTSTAQTTSWKDYLGGPAASHYSPLKQINTGNVNKLDVAWTYPTGDDVTYTFSPLVVDNIAYFAAKQGSLVAVDATTGKELWVHSFPTGERHAFALWRDRGHARRQLLGEQGPKRSPPVRPVEQASSMPSMRGQASWWTPSPTTESWT